MILHMDVTDITYFHIYLKMYFFDSIRVISIQLKYK